MSSSWMRATVRTRASSVLYSALSVAMSMVLMGSMMLYSASQIAPVSISRKKPKNSENTRATNW